MYKVLVIGCGNIGALYDINTNEITTHTKAWHSYPDKVDVTIFDTDANLLNLISDHYSCKSVENISVKTLSAFDCISICTPTYTHAEILHNAFLANVKTIICEKPISLKESDFNKLIRSYQGNNSRVLVNYIRRFLPSFSDLKRTFEELMIDNSITNISVRYQRGFLNNCSHAFDLIEYLFDRKLLLDDVTIHNSVNDHFDYDPTISLQGYWNAINVSVQGLSNILFSYFEIDIFLTKHKISIKNSGDTIEFFESNSEGVFFKPLNLDIQKSQYNCLKNYMKFVIDEVLLLMDGTILADNFIDAIDLNQRMLKYIKN
ncbi:Gfo/Idh/MocA family protein [Pedobacter heparinus]|uniref:Oxidoreductase domain protein n=1 Tax=Pedobacter heparinus (strain ATCC 13125 / DSM 2366 / CIP 104194 / JCM 7457 / NBRC 12017 / NCIMB 9290 / NRRL B-14731 / HIM 762-3) TaxID=485917 RepID=C6XVQ6_PEDHD|nr:Gfo/Idh/MocA family oxidoreductase [Pedobacter heparinus]ACU06131.1 oxidoreductase domain protein [Pedobacter heparinus DSM 2366]